MNGEVSDSAISKLENSLIRHSYVKFENSIPVGVNIQKL